MIDRCQYGRTGISPGAGQCTARAAQGSIYCQPHRAEALQRAAAVVVRPMQQRWSPPRRGTGG